MKKSMTPILLILAFLMTETANARGQLAAADGPAIAVFAAGVVTGKCGAQDADQGKPGACKNEAKDLRSEYSE